MTGRDPSSANCVNAASGGRHSGQVLDLHPTGQLRSALAAGFLAASGVFDGGVARLAAPVAALATSAALTTSGGPLARRLLTAPTIRAVAT